MTRDCTHIVQYREVNHRGRVDYRYLIHRGGAECIKYHKSRGEAEWFIGR